MGTINNSSHAAELHKQAIVIDSHSDILMALADGVTRFGDWLQLPDPLTWSPPPRTTFAAFSPPTSAFGANRHTEYFGASGLYSLPQMLAGGLTLQVCAIYLEDKQLDRALQRALEMTWWLLQEAREHPQFEVVRTVADIRRIKEQGKAGGVLSFEGLEPLGNEIRFLDLFYQLGLRIASLTHNRRNAFADGPQGDVQTGGLTHLGRLAIRRLNELGIVVDLAHTNAAAFWEILELSEQPVIHSHLSPFSFSLMRGETPPYKDFQSPDSRKRLQALAQKDGVAGCIFFGQQDLDEVIASIEELGSIMGVRHVGLGSDFYGLQFAPLGLESMDKLPRITERLLARGWVEGDILALLGGNFLRVFEKVWKT
jgi:membrane dipeptidase